MLEFDFWKALLRIIIVLPVVLLLAYFFLKIFLSRKNFSLQRGYMQVLEQVGVGSRASLVIAKVGNDYYLLGVTEQQVVLLQKLPDYEPQQLSRLETSRFSELLGKLHRGREEDRK